MKKQYYRKDINRPHCQESTSKSIPESSKVTTNNVIDNSINIERQDSDNPKYNIAINLIVSTGGGGEEKQDKSDCQQIKASFR